MLKEDYYLEKTGRSRPTRACELKFENLVNTEYTHKSRPTRACELKSMQDIPDRVTLKVTPHAGV